MRHSLQGEQFGVRLRPVRLEDAGFIVWLRNLEHAKGRVGDSAENVASQEQWLKKYFEREGDYYFIVETLTAIPVGTYGIYDVRGTSGESGRYIMRPEVPAAVPCAMIAFELAFQKLGLTELRGRVVSTNQRSISLGLKYGFREVGVDRGGQVIGGQSVDMVLFLLDAKDWPPNRQRLLPLARLAETQINQWQHTQLQQQPQPR